MGNDAAAHSVALSSGARSSWVALHRRGPLPRLPWRRQALAPRLASRPALRDVVPMLHGDGGGECGSLRATARVTIPHHICRLIGHRRESYVGGYYTDRRGRQREKRYSRCTRSGTSDGAEVYREGLMERFSWRRIRAWRWRARNWWRTDCIDCGQPATRFGRPFGDHDDCLPF